MELSRAHGDAFDLGRDLTALAANLAMCGRLAEGASPAKVGLAAARSAGHTFQIAMSLLAVAFIARDDNPTVALALFDEVAGLATESGDTMPLAFARANSGRLHARLGRFDLAARDLSEALQLCASRRDRAQTSNVFVLTADAFVDRRMFEDAARIHGAANTLAPGMNRAEHGGIGPSRELIDDAIGADRYEILTAEGAGLEEAHAFTAAHHPLNRLAQESGRA